MPAHPGCRRGRWTAYRCFFKDLVQLFLADVSNLSPKGDRNLAFYGRQGDIALFHKLGIEGLALGCEKIDALIIQEHHVNDPGLGVPILDSMWAWGEGYKASLQ